MAYYSEEEKMYHPGGEEGVCPHPAHRVRQPGDAFCRIISPACTT